MRKFQMQRVGMISLASAMGVMLVPLLSATALAGPVNDESVNLAQALKKTVLVFPFDMPATVPNRLEVQQLLSDMALSRLLAANSYSVVLFNKNLPTVARLHIDQQLTDSDISEPYTEGSSKATKIGKLVGYDVAFLGSIADYQYDEAGKVVTLVVSGQLVDVKTGKFVTTPVTLTASSSKGSSAKEPGLALEAGRKAGEQLLQKLIPISGGAIVPAKVVSTPVTTEKKKKKGNDLLWGLLAVGLGLGIGIAGSGKSGGGGGGSDSPPAHP